MLHTNASKTRTTSSTVLLPPYYELAMLTPCSWIPFTTWTGLVVLDSVALNLNPLLVEVLKAARAKHRRSASSRRRSSEEPEDTIH
jgi:hypothetical protein